MRAEQLAGTLVNRNSFYSLQAYNNQAAAKNSTPARANEKNGRRDTAAISPMQRANSMIEAIRKQKQNIVENKNQLVKNTMEAGKDIETIQPQLDSYNEMLQTLDEQIVGIIASMADQKAAELEKLKEKAEAAKDDEPKTQEELQAEHLNNLAGAVDSLKQSEVVSSVKRKTVGEAKVKQTEVMAGELFIERLESRKKLDRNLNVKDVIASERRSIRAKNAEISALEDRASALDLHQGTKLNDAVTKLEENNKPIQKTVKDEDKDGIEDSPSMEITLSREDEKKEAVVQ